MLTALLVDDEKKNRDSLRKLLSEYCRNVQIVGEATSVDEAVVEYRKLKPELVFLDVEMPNGTGFDFIRQTSPANYKVIFVTAHTHYAIKAIRFSAIDYLVKPVDTDDLVKAVEKAASTPIAKAQFDTLIENLERKTPGRLAIPVKDGFAFLNPAEIIRLQADGTYTHIYTKDDKFTGTKNIKEYEDLLLDYGFFRSHNSHLINLSHVKRFSRLDGYFVHMSDNSTAEISRRKREEFLGLMNGEAS